MPTIKVSSQAMVLKMALEKMYGAAGARFARRDDGAARPPGRDDGGDRRQERGQQPFLGASVSGAANSRRPACTWCSIRATCSAARRATRWCSVRRNSTRPIRRRSLHSSRRWKRPISSSPGSGGGREDLSRCYQGEIHGRRNRRDDQGAQRRVFDDAERDHGIRRFHGQDRTDQDQAGIVEGVLFPCRPQISGNVTVLCPMMLFAGHMQDHVASN